MENDTAAAAAAAAARDRGVRRKIKISPKMRR